jgi:DNA polymerase-3 subunit gamma/tau
MLLILLAACGPSVAVPPLCHELEGGAGGEGGSPTPEGGQGGAYGGSGGSAGGSAGPGGAVPEAMCVTPFCGPPAGVCETVVCPLGDMPQPLACNHPTDGFTEPPPGLPNTPPEWCSTANVVEWSCPAGEVVNVVCCCNHPTEEP